MGAIIEGIGVARPRRWQRRPSSVELARRAGEQALEAAGCAPGQVDLIINTGVYRDENICEPAMAPFIQRKLGANASFSALPEHNTFSFDLNNGACGLLSALQVVDGFIQSGMIRRGLVVTSDVDPTPGVSEGWDFEPVGAAVLLTEGEPGLGFTAFHTESFDKYAHLFEAQVPFTGKESPSWRRRFRRQHSLRVRREEGFVEACARCSATALERLFEERVAETRDLPLVVPSCAPAGFPRVFAQTSRVPRERILVLEEGPVHTAGPALALEAGLRSEHADHGLLVVAAGSGITVSLALYRPANRGSSDDLAKVERA